MSVFRRKYSGKDGKAKTVRKWSVDFRDHDGIMRRVPGFSDRAASVELERSLNPNYSYQLLETGRIVVSISCRCS
jgi:hypothetical protein